MEEKELQDLLAKVQEASKEAANEATKEQFVTLQKQIEDLKNEANTETIKSEIGRLAGELKALKETPKGSLVGYKTIKEALTHAVKDKMEDFKAIAKNPKDKRSISIEIKESGEVDTVGLSTTIETGDTQYTITQNTGIVSQIRKRETRYLANVSVGSIGTSRALWVEETGEDGAPIATAEMAKKGQAFVKYIEKDQRVKKTTVFVKISTEFFQDLAYLVSYLYSNLMKRLDIKIEDDLLYGDGIGENLEGAFEYATAFTGGGLEVDSPNELDVLEALSLQTKLADGEPNAVMVNPLTMSQIRLIKENNTGRPIWKDYITPSGEFSYSGLRVIESKAIEPGEFIGGDMTVLQVYNRSTNIEFGLDGNDLTENKRTTVMERRLVQFVSGNDVQCLIKGDFATAKQLITKGS